MAEMFWCLCCDLLLDECLVKPYGVYSYVSQLEGMNILHQSRVIWNQVQRQVKSGEETGRPNRNRLPKMFVDRIKGQGRKWTTRRGRRRGRKREKLTSNFTCLPDE